MNKDQIKGGLKEAAGKVQEKAGDTLAYNVTHTRLNPEAKIIITTRPTSLQTKAFELLGLNPACTQ